MNKADFIKVVARTLRENKATKTVSIPKRVFTISDDTGKSSSFTVKSSDREVMYTIDDVETVIECCIAVLEDAIKHGDSVSFHGIGSLGVAYRMPKMVRIPDTGEWTEIPGHYSPKFSVGALLRMDAKIYEESLNDTMPSLPPPVYDEYEEGDD